MIIHLLVNHRLVCCTIYVSSQLFVFFNYITLCRNKLLFVKSLQLNASITNQILTHDLQSWKHQYYLVNGLKTLPQKAFIHLYFIITLSLSLITLGTELTRLLIQGHYQSKFSKWQTGRGRCTLHMLGSLSYKETCIAWV